jgi:nucleoid DNA-binding protein
MRHRHGLATGVLLGALVVVLGLADTAHSQRPGEEPAGVPQRVAKATGFKLQEVEKVLKALAPAIRDELAAGQTVSLDGLGTFRVVRVASHRDLRNGRVSEIPAVNRVEFVPSDATFDSANSATAVPAEEVEEFRYIPLPGQTPVDRTPNTKVPPRRVR